MGMKHNIIQMSMNSYSPPFRKWDIIEHHAGIYKYSIVVNTKKDDCDGVLVTSHPIKTFKNKWIRKLHFKLIRYTFSIPMNEE